MWFLIIIFVLSAFLAALLQHARGCDRRSVVMSSLLGLLLGPVGVLISLAVGGKLCPLCQRNIDPHATICPKCRGNLYLLERQLFIRTITRQH